MVTTGRKDTENVFSIKAVFKPDYERYERVRTINIYLLRLLFLLVVVFRASDSWSASLKREGQWDHVKAAARHRGIPTLVKKSTGRLAGRRYGACICVG